MKKFILILMAFNVYVIQANAQLQAQPQVKNQVQVTTDSVELDSVVLYQDKLMELGKTNFVEKDGIANFKGKRFEKAVENINKKDFDALVESSINLFKNKNFEQMTDIENRNIIRAINTITVQELRGDMYDELEEMINTKDYAVKMTTKYKWTYSKGMGFNFLELGIELDGSKSDDNIFAIKK
jgi:triacylglycerol esterase/lipase EstA (alpha/beta hydrolase family)